MCNVFVLLCAFFLYFALKRKFKLEICTYFECTWKKEHFEVPPNNVVRYVIFLRGTITYIVYVHKKICKF